MPIPQQWMKRAGLATTMRSVHLTPSIGRQFADAVAPVQGPGAVIDNTGRESPSVPTEGMAAHNAV